ncbi:NmrA family NAD(P)-binding protein [Nocardioides zeae]|uniref:NmrA family NAD(P)-binding protein n=1 Tax=Nocardioides imazamoxiresistens TaxID=3231893 RepID=A0ABU3PXR2_9ACTN|nr:NmrA family NAD(P)-binding protein [Nocardioides zeae]MDT9594026.1 NmrA family NAD(P)-binding protein [Nocardioides zeae]
MSSPRPTLRVAVTGASGKTGAAVVAGLLEAGHRPVGLVRRPEAAEALQTSGAEARVVDLDGGRDDLVAALADVDAVHHVPPNMHPAEDELTASVVEAAEAAGVDRFVYHSVLHPYVPAMPHHLRKAVSELRVRRSALRWTILQPASYAQNLLPFWEAARDTGTYRVPYDVDRPFTPVDLADVAAAVVAVLDDPATAHGTFELVGPEVLTSRDMAAALGEAAGRPVVAEPQPVAQWRAGVDPSGTRRDLDDLAAMFDWYDTHGLVGSSLALRTLLGREPTTLRAALRRDLGLGTTPAP